jgi:quercetin dioxygenase-like cupin family protein
LYTTCQSSTPRDHTRDLRPSFAGTRTWWLVDRAAGGAEWCTAGIFELDPGRGFPLHRHRHAAEAIVILEGEGSILTAGGEHPAPPGAVLFAPANAWHAIHAGAAPLRALSVYAGVSRAADAGWEEAGAGAAGGEAPMISRLGGLLVDRQVTRDTRLVLRTVRSDGPPGAALPALAGAATLVYVLDGEGDHVADAGRRTPLAAGDVLYLPSGGAGAVTGALTAVVGQVAHAR